MQMLCMASGIASRKAIPPFPSQMGHARFYPNDCFNSLVVRCNFQSLKRFKVGQEDHYDADRICDADCALSFRRLVSNKASSTAQENRELWGTKLEPYNVRHEDNIARGKLYYGVYTAWDPPHKWLEKVAAAYPD